MPKRRKDEPAEPVEENEDEEVWDVEEILDHRVRRGVKEYKVLWLGYPIEQASWEPLDHLLQNCKKKLKQYQRKLEDDCKKQLRNRPIITTPAKSSSPKGRGAYIEDDSDEDNAPAKTPEREESSSSESSTEESTSEESPSDESVYETEPDEPSTSTAKPKKKKKRDGSPKVRVVSFVRDGPLKRNPSSGQPLEIRKRPKTSTAGTPTSSKKPRLDVVNERSKDATPTRVQKNRPPSSRPIRPYVAPTQQRPATTASSSTKSARPDGKDAKKTAGRPSSNDAPAPTTKQPTPKKTPRRVYRDTSSDEDSQQLRIDESFESSTGSDVQTNGLDETIPVDGPIMPELSDSEDEENRAPVEAIAAQKKSAEVGEKEVLQVTHEQLEPRAGELQEEVLVSSQTGPAVVEDAVAGGLPTAAPTEAVGIAEEPLHKKKTAEVIAEVLFDARPKTNEGAGLVIKAKTVLRVRATFSAPTPPPATPAAAPLPEAAECAPPASPQAPAEDAAPESPPPTPKRVVLNIPQLAKPPWALPAEARSSDYSFQLPDILLTAILGVEQDAEPAEETRVEGPVVAPISAEEPPVYASPPAASTLTPADSPTAPSAPTDARAAEEPRPSSPKPKVVKLALPPAKKTTVRPVLAPPRPKAPERTDAANLLDAVLAATAGLYQQPAAPVPAPVPPPASIPSFAPPTAPPAASVAAPPQPPPVVPPRKPLGLCDPRPNAERYRAEALARMAALEQQNAEQIAPVQAAQPPAPVEAAEVPASTQPAEAPVQAAEAPAPVEATERTTAQMALYEDALKKMVDYYTTWGFSMYPNPFLDPVNANQPVVFREVFQVPDPATGEVVPMVAVEFGGRPRLWAATWSDVLDSGNSLPFWE